MGTVAKEKKTKREPLTLLARVKVLRDVESLNSIQKKIRRGATNAKLVMEWGRRLQGVMLEQLGPDWMQKIEVTQPHPQRRLEIIRRCSRELDFDNFVGGCKPLIDALKSVSIRVGGTTVDRKPGWFFDDTKTYLKMLPVQIQTGEEPWVEISLYGRTGSGEPGD